MQSHKNTLSVVLTTMGGLVLMLSGCFGNAGPDGNDDAAYGMQPDLSPLCSGNNDGVIARSELQFPLNLPVNYLSNPSGTTVMVQPSGTTWDLTSTAGDVHQLTLEPIESFWFASSFPNATYVTTADLGSDTLGIFRVTDDALLILGFASRAPNQTLLVYDAPIASLHFPIQQGDAWVTGAKIVNGTLNGAPFASSDTYRISVDAKGRATLPFLAFDNTLRVHVELSQALPGGVAVTHIQYLFFHECYGELGRMVSNPGETDPNFTTASEFRRLAL
jgi:hypothetical protein